MGIYLSSDSTSSWTWISMVEGSSKKGWSSHQVLECSCRWNMPLGHTESSWADVDLRCLKTRERSLRKVRFDGGNANRVQSPATLQKWALRFLHVFAEAQCFGYSLLRSQCLQKPFVTTTPASDHATARESLRAFESFRLEKHWVISDWLSKLWSLWSVIVRWFSLFQIEGSLWSVWLCLILLFILC